MRNVPALLRRELNAYFSSVLGYVVLMFFLIVMGVTFGVVVNFLSTGPKQQTAMYILFRMYWLPSLVIIPRAIRSSMWASTESPAAFTSRGSRPI